MRRVLLVGFTAVAVFATTSPASAKLQSQRHAKIGLQAKSHTVKSSTLCTTWSPEAIGTFPQSYNTASPTGLAQDVYLMVMQAPDTTLAIAALSCGIVYNNNSSNSRYCGSPGQVPPASDAYGVDVFGWTLCTTGLEFTNGCDLNNANTEWPESGGGNRITWYAVPGQCGENVIQGKITVSAGAFYLYAYDQDFFAISPNNNLLSGPGEFQVADCTAAITDLSWPKSAGYVWFSPGATIQGCNPATAPTDTLDGSCDTVPVKNVATWGKIKQMY